MKGQGLTHTHTHTHTHTIIYWTQHLLECRYSLRRQWSLARIYLESALRTIGFHFMGNEAVSSNHVKNDSACEFQQSFNSYCRLHHCRSCRHFITTLSVSTVLAMPFLCVYMSVQLLTRTADSYKMAGWLRIILDWGPPTPSTPKQNSSDTGQCKGVANIVVWSIFSRRLWIRSQPCH